MREALALCPVAVPIVGAACHAVSGAAGSVAGAGADAVFAAAGTWVASGAVWLLDEVGRVMSASTAIDLGTGWFAAHEAVMASLAAAVLLPMVCCAAIQAVYRQSASMLLRTFLVHLPLCLLLTGVAVALVRIGLAVTDDLSAQVLAGAGVDTTNLFSGLTAFFASSGGAPAVPAFVVFVGALFVALSALVLWLELAVRAAAVTAAALFLPLALAALVWPAVSHWCRRLADTLVALVLSKLVIAAVLSLAASALAGGLGLAGTDGGGFAAVVTGIALLLIATLSPFTLLRLVPAVEAGAVAQLESARHRMHGAVRAPIRSGGNLALDLARGAGGDRTGDEGAALGSDTTASAIPMVAGLALGPEAAAVTGPMAAAWHGAGPRAAGSLGDRADPDEMRATGRPEGSPDAVPQPGPLSASVSASGDGDGPPSAQPDAVVPPARGDGGARGGPDVPDRRWPED